MFTHSADHLSIPDNMNPALHHIYILSGEPINISITKRMISASEAPVTGFNRPSELFAHLPLMTPSCLLLDIALPELNGLRVMDRIRQLNYYMPIIFSVNRAESEMLVKVMNKGAFGIVQKPYNQTELLDTVQRALLIAHKINPHIQEVLNYNQKVKNLTLHESEILTYLEKAYSAKEISKIMELSYRTIENSRVRIYKKLGIKTASQLQLKINTSKVLKAHGTIN